jgi:hypothetical protein
MSVLPLLGSASCERRRDASSINPHPLAELASAPSETERFVAAVDAAFEASGLVLETFDRFRSSLCATSIAGCMSDRIYTIGHGNRSIDELVSALRAHEIAQLVDVRSFPGSRRNPQFGREELERSLPANGIAYVWMKDLGGRRRAVRDSPHTGWRVEGFRAYADYMDTPTFAAAVDELLHLAQQAPTAYMCAERLWWQCHRRLVSDALTVRGIAVTHIYDAQKTEQHRLTEFLRVENGRLLYREGGA